MRTANTGNNKIAKIITLHMLQGVSLMTDLAICWTLQIWVVLVLSSCRDLHGDGAGDVEALITEIDAQQGLTITLYTDLPRQGCMPPQNA